ncbi:MAG: hypothetical protein AAF628_16580 [Planctomycetota bacterium]
MNRCWLALALLLLGVACRSTADPRSGAVDAVGVETPITVLDHGWVRFEGERRPVEFFLLQMRRRVRAAEGVGPEGLPLVRVMIGEGAPGVTAQWLDWLGTELYKAGVQRIVLGGGGA